MAADASGGETIVRRRFQRGFGATSSPVAGPLANPLGYGGLYAAGNTNVVRDRSGYAIETGWDVANVVMGVASFVSNVSEGNYGWAAVDAAGVAYDTFASAAPDLPGGAGTVIAGARAADKGADLVRAASAVSDVGAGASKSGSATVYWKGGHASVETRTASGSVLHTDQAPLGGRTTGAIADEAMKVNPERTSTLPDADSAQAYQRGTLGADLGAYDRATNSCVTSCGEVLNAGGAEINTSSSWSAAKDILKQGQ